MLNREKQELLEPVPEIIGKDKHKYFETRKVINYKYYGL